MHTLHLTPSQNIVLDGQTSPYRYLEYNGMAFLRHCETGDMIRLPYDRYELTAHAPRNHHYKSREQFIHDFLIITGNV